MTPTEERFLDQHEALHYAVLIQRSLNRDVSIADITDLAEVSRRLRKKKATAISAIIILAELNVLRQEQKARILGFNRLVEFIVANWNIEVRRDEEPDYANMSAEEAYDTLLNIKHS